MKAFVITSVLAASLGLAAPAADVLALADRDIACSSGVSCANRGFGQPDWKREEKAKANAFRQPDWKREEESAANRGFGQPDWKREETVEANAFGQPDWKREDKVKANAFGQKDW